MLKVSNVTDVNKGSLKSTFDVEVPVWGGTMKIANCKLFEKNVNRWINMPSYSVEDPMTKERVWLPVVEFSKEIHQRIQVAALEALKTPFKEAEALSSKRAEELENQLDDVPDMF